MSYSRPPAGYKQPKRCTKCNGTIYFAPVIGGRKWLHMGSSDHDVVMRASGYWDVNAGEIVHGNPVRKAA